MSVDFSILKNIDFTNPENIIFLSILAVVGLICFIIFLIVLFQLIKEIKKIFKIESKKPQMAQKESVDWLRERLQNNQETADMPKQTIAKEEFMAMPSLKSEPVEEKDKEKLEMEKEQKAIAEDLSKLEASGSPEKETLQSKMPSRTGTAEEDNHQGIKIPRAKRVMGGDVLPKNVSGEEAQKTDIKMAQAEKGQKAIKEDLNKLKSSASPEKETLQSKMPSKTENQENSFEKTAFSTNSGVIEPQNYKTPTVNNGAILPPEKTASAGVETKPGEKMEKNKESFFEKLGFVQNKMTKKLTGNKKGSQQVSEKDQSIFGGKPEVSKISLEYKMKKNPNIWKASKVLGLNLSPVERSKLVKEIFPGAYGRNISKTDLVWGIKKLNQKMLNTTDQAEHAKIRKEIKFFKKIGGIK